MRPKALLIAKEESESNPTIAEAAARTDLLLLRASDARQAFDLLGHNLASLDLVIIDVDPGIHSMALLEAITAHENAPPVIVVTGFEQAEMAPIARRHGAAACIAKPFTAAELVTRIERVCPAEHGSSEGSCDQWGHLHLVRHKEAHLRCACDCGDCTAHAVAAAAG